MFTFPLHSPPTAYVNSLSLLLSLLFGFYINFLRNFSSLFFFISLRRNRNRHHFPFHREISSKKKYKFPLTSTNRHSICHPPSIASFQWTQQRSSRFNLNFFLFHLMQSHEKKMDKKKFIPYVISSCTAKKNAHTKFSRG